ncbi:unnamed protein product [Rotaria sp. Silwood2]|nr:unnamed protein product [Rotaria sp. Silwood2]
MNFQIINANLQKQHMHEDGLHPSIQSGRILIERAIKKWFSKQKDTFSSSNVDNFDKRNNLAQNNFNHRNHNNQQKQQQHRYRYQYKQYYHKQQYQQQQQHNYQIDINNKNVDQPLSLSKKRKQQQQQQQQKQKFPQETQYQSSKSSEYSLKSNGAGGPANPFGDGLLIGILLLLLLLLSSIIIVSISSS